MTTAYLAADGFEAELDTELIRRGVTVRARHGRLRIAEGPAVPVIWAANVWFDAVELPIRSIGDAAAQLRAMQRSWAPYAPEFAGRVRLIAEKLPHVSARPLQLGEVAPAAPLGSFTLLAPDRLLAAARCSSPFPNGEPHLAEDRDGPPSRAYLKLWEAFLALGAWPSAGERCLDLGASPGGWTWLLAQRGATVTAVDKAPLAPTVASLPNVTERAGSAFALRPEPFDWVVSDVIAYPDRLVPLVQRWLPVAGRLICTIKLQGPTDHAAIDTLRPLGRVVHLHHNRHEVTFLGGGSGHNADQLRYHS